MNGATAHPQIAKDLLQVFSGDSAFNALLLRANYQISLNRRFQLSIENTSAIYDDGKYDRTVAGPGISIELTIPEHISDSEAEQIAVELALLANEAYKSLGGKGLEIAGVDMMEAVITGGIMI